MASAIAGVRDDPEAALWSRLRHGEDAGARASLFDLHLAFATMLARRSHRRRSLGDLDRADLVQQAGAALLESIDRYAPDRGVPFRAFAARRILGSLSDAIARSSEVRQQSAALHRIRQERVRELRPDRPDALRDDEALDALVELTAGLAIGLMIEDGAGEDREAACGYRSAAWQETCRRLRAELAHLPERERAVLDYHYLRGVSFATIAALLDLSAGRISQLHRAALTTLRKRLAMRGHVSLGL